MNETTSLLDIMPILQQLFIAVGLGFVIGVERELAHRAAGVRTHSLVSLGDALFSIMSTEMVGAGGDQTIAPSIVSGIGFLGAGLIIFHGNKLQGLTTAAGIWVAAAIGMAVGFKLYALAIVATILTIGIFAVLYPIEHRFISRIANNNGNSKED